MYAVIRAGGKQYRVAPGDVIRVESQGNGSDGQIGKPQSEARVVGEVLGQGRGDKILVFHYKRKKQYKKLAGHRQPFTAVRITEIAYDGQSFKAPAVEKKQPQPKRVKPAAETEELPKVEAKADKAAPKKKTVTKKPAAKKS